MKFSFPMPKEYPKSFKVITEELQIVIDQITRYRDTNKTRGLGAFFDEWEGLYFEALSSKGEQQKIKFTTLYLIWCQMMAIVKGGVEDDGRTAD